MLRCPKCDSLNVVCRTRPYGWGREHVLICEDCRKEHDLDELLRSKDPAYREFRDRYFPAPTAQGE